MVREINDIEYKELIKKDNKVVIDCYASWCGPCKMLSPIIDSLADEYKDIEFYKVNVDDAEIITEEFNIMSIPTLLIFENGELKEKVVGLKSKSELEDLIK